MSTFEAAFGVAMGSIIYWVKFFLVYAMLKPFPRLRDKLHSKWYGMLAVDIGSGFIAASMMNPDSNVGMVGYCTFAAWSGLTIVSLVFWHWFSKETSLGRWLTGKTSDKKEEVITPTRRRPLSERFSQ